MSRDFKFLMANVLWSDNGWTKIDPSQRGKNQFSWTKQNPEDHADGTLFKWGEMDRVAYVPINRNPRWYTLNNNGSGLLFVTSRSIHDGTYYIVGLFSKFTLYSDDWGYFTCYNRNSLRFERYIPLDIIRHCPQRLDGSTRLKTFGRNNFNHIEGEWANNIIEDAIKLHETQVKSSLPYCTYTGETALGVLNRVHRAYFRR